MKEGKIVFVAVFCIIWVLVVAAWGKWLYIMPMVITDSYFFWPEGLEKDKRFNAAEWQKVTSDDHAVLRRTCYFDSEFYAFEFTQEKELDAPDSSITFMTDAEVEAKVESIVWVTAFGSFAYWLFCFLIYWVCSKLFRSKPSRATGVQIG